MPTVWSPMIHNCYPTLEVCLGPIWLLPDCIFFPLGTARNCHLWEKELQVDVEGASKVLGWWTHLCRRQTKRSLLHGGPSVGTSNLENRKQLGSWWIQLVGRGAMFIFSLESVCEIWFLCTYLLQASQIVAVRPLWHGQRADAVRDPRADTSCSWRLARRQ